MNAVEDNPPSKKAKTEDVMPEKMVETELVYDDDGDNDLTYEQLRAKRMKENMAMFETLGIHHAAEVFVSSIISKPKPTKSFKTKPIVDRLPPTRRSLRIANLPLPNNEIEKNHMDENNFKDSQTNTNLSTPNLEMASASNVLNKKSITVPEKESIFFEKLSRELAVKEPVDNLHACEFKRFCKVVKSLEMNTDKSLKVTNSRIYSIAVHPIKTSLMVAVGSQKGFITLYNTKDGDVQEYKIHNAPINCTSFCSWDPLKLFTTSHDGSVRCGDIKKSTFDIIYSSKLNPNAIKMSHTTWHTEFERNILIGCGAGHVDMIDLRIPNKIQQTAWCHTRSVRTVQCHPIETHNFLTSSGIGEVSLWDVRKMNDQKIDPVLKFEHFKSLTSAFFSSSGARMVTTSADDYIRIFDTKKLTSEATTPTNKIKHNNQTSRWISVPKAKWNPGRDDVFFIGSTILPKGMEIYGANGDLLHTLISENMTTYSPVIEVHPTQAIYVGGNASGRLHIFSTQRQFH